MSMRKVMKASICRIHAKDGIELGSSGPCGTVDDNFKPKSWYKDDKAAGSGCGGGIIPKSGISATYSIPSDQFQVFFITK